MELGLGPFTGTDGQKQNGFYVAAKYKHSKRSEGQVEEKLSYYEKLFPAIKEDLDIFLDAVADGTNEETGSKTGIDLLMTTFVPEAEGLKFAKLPIRRSTKFSTIYLVRKE